MMFYKHHIGDFARDAGYLSLIEEGAYRRLLDAYYAHERALPQSLDACCRLTRAVTKKERAAVRFVLETFFIFAGDGYHNPRCDKEIAAYRDRSDTAKRNANARWGACNPHSDPHSVGIDSAMLTTNHKPVTKKELPPTAAPAEPPDPIFGAGLAMLKRKGVAERPARSFLGMLRKKLGDLETSELLARCESEEICDPLAWLRKCADERSAGKKQGGAQVVQIGTPRRRRPLGDAPSVAQSFADKVYTGTPDAELPDYLRSDAGKGAA